MLTARAGAGVIAEEVEVEAPASRTVVEILGETRAPYPIGEVLAVIDMRATGAR